ncbi:dynein regulatory complex protein 1 homolog [Diorhabda sublineata]|uniref:dynein regulatory complex protein 1 homolog n=1 Tax=Diorhabda sublineata TaxID=1163346 RepID=UPI0024E14981|nr:dynein regulatory complex protein 1 homolog [Diorhabda sublineata]
MEIDLNKARIEVNDREVEKRDKDGVNKKQLLERLEEEARNAQNDFEEIAVKWSLINKFNDPYHIQQNIETQKDNCMSVIKRKDELIADLKNILLKSAREYDKEQAKQIQDINELTRKIEKQLNISKAAYKTQFNLISDIVLALKGNYVESAYTKWSEMQQEMCAMEAKHSEDQFRALEEFQTRMKNIRENFDELFRERNLQLSNVIDTSRQQFETIKSIALLNSEKLDYNYMILSCREEENIILKGQQKRRINKLQDIITDLKKKVYDYKKSSFNQIKKYKETIKKLQKSILDIEVKADNFSSINDRKFHQLWEINKKECLDLLNKIMDIDRILHEQQMAVEWLPPRCLSMDNSTMESYGRALSFINSNTPMEKALKSLEGFPANKSILYKKLLKQILTKLSDKSGFLTEKRLKFLISRYEDEQQSMVTLENVFHSLNIMDEKYLDIILQYFLPYCYCRFCSYGEQIERSVGSQISALTYSYSIAITERSPMAYGDISTLSEALKSTHGSMDAIESAVLELATDVKVKPLASDSEISLGTTLLNIPGDEEQSISNRKSLMPRRKVHASTYKLRCELHHPLVISTIYVLTALRQFVEAYYADIVVVPTTGERLRKQRLTVSRLLEDSEIEDYWQRVRLMYDESRLKVWDALLRGLKYYHEVLKERKTVALEVTAMRKVNAKLKKKLARYQDRSILLPPICVNNYTR